MEPLLPFADLSLSEPPDVRVGPAGWSYPDWNRIVYPANKKRGFDPLRYLSRYFDTIEINSTFYRPALPKIFLNWAERVEENPHFRFSVKCWKRFTHEKKPLSMADMKQVFPGLEALHETGTLGCILFQFPWSFRNDMENRVYIREIRDCFQHFPIVLEVRHESWNQEAFFGYLKHLQIGFANLDQPVLRKCIPPTEITTAPTAYVRLHGRNDQDWFRKDAGRDDRYNYLYTQEELEDWVTRIKRLKRKAKEIYVITNNHFKGQAVCNAFQLQTLLGQPPRMIPESLKERFPELRRLETG